TLNVSVAAQLCRANEPMGPLKYCPGNWPDPKQVESDGNDRAAAESYKEWTKRIRIVVQLAAERDKTSSHFRRPDRRSRSKRTQEVHLATSSKTAPYSSRRYSSNACGL